MTEMDMGPDPLPDIGTVVVSDIADVLRLGLRDFLRAPLFGLFFSAVYVAGGLLLWQVYGVAGQQWWLAPVAVGFPLFAPFAAVGLYEVSRRIEASLGRAKVRGTEGHVILIGLGSVGMRILDGLRKRGKEVVVIERDEDNRYSSQARLLGVRVILGDATLERTLEAANLSTASAVAVMTSDDMTNIEAGLAVREGLGNRWEKTPVILRVFDRELGFRLEQSFEFRHVWSTAAIAAPWFVGAAIGMEVLATFYVGREPFQVAKLKVKEGGGLVGMRMVDLGAKARVLAINRSDEDSGMEYPPRRGTKFGPGDNAYIAGPYDELMKILRMDKTPAVPGQS